MAWTSPRAAPARFPYHDHRTLADVWGIARAPEPEPTVSQKETVAPPPAPRPIPAPRIVDKASKIDLMSAESAFGRFMRGEF